MTTTLTNKPYNYSYLKLISQVDKITDDITNIQNSVSGNICVTETYQNGTSWYRVYSDGWCEQGGVANATYTGTVVTLLKPYRDTNYKGLAINNGGNTSATINTAFTARSTTQITLASGFTAAASTIWRTWGYIE